MACVRCLYCLALKNGEAIVWLDVAQLESRHSALHSVARVVCADIVVQEIKALILIRTKMIIITKINIIIVIILFVI